MTKRLIISGVVVFLVVVTFPLWYNAIAGDTSPRLQPEPPAKVEGKEYKCIEDKAYMTGNHMQLLMTWRDIVVREGKTTYTSEDNEEYNISLTKTCLSCHHKKETFCDRCHDYAHVRPNCWKCHVEPRED